MKIGKIFLISLLLLVLTIGVVSADDNITQDVNEPLGEAVSDEPLEVSSDDAVMEDDFPSEINIAMPKDTYVKGEKVYFAVTLNNGKMDVSVDGTPRPHAFLESADEEADAFYVNSTDLSKGAHTLSVKVTNDTYYADVSKDFKFYIKEELIVKVPKNAVINNHPYMTIEMPYDATGNVKILVNGKEIYSSNAKQFIQQFLTDYLNLSKKDNINKVRVIYSEDSMYAYDKTFDVIATYDILASNYTFDYGEPGKYYYFTLIGGISKDKISATIDGKEYAVYHDGGYSYRIYVSKLASGKHTVIISYSGDANHYQNSVTRTIDVIPKIILNVRSYLYNDNNTVYLKLPKDATGNLSLYSDGKLFRSKKVVNGSVTISIAKLKPGFHNLYAVYDGKDYNVMSLNRTVCIGIDWNVDDCNVSQKPVCTFTVPSDLRGKITVSYDGKNYTHNCNGNFKIVLPKASNAGRYQVWMYYSEGNTVLCKEFEVLVISPKYNIPPKVTDGKGSIVVYAHNPKANVTVNVKSSKDSYKLFAKVVDGKATVSLAKLNAGKYAVNIFYEAADTYFSEHATITVANTKLAAKDLTKYYGSSSTFNVKVTDYKGKVVKYKYVKFYINGKYFTKVKTTKNGWADLKINKLPGKYNVMAKYGNVEITRKVTVKNVLTLKTADVKKSAKSLTLKATLKQGKKAIKYKKVTFKFKGKTYTAKTNKNGVAKVTIKKSVLKKLKVGKTVAYQVTYLKCTVKKTAKVKK